MGTCCGCQRWSRRPPAPSTSPPSRSTLITVCSRYVQVHDLSGLYGFGSPETFSSKTILGHVRATSVVTDCFCSLICTAHSCVDLSYMWRWGSSHAQKYLNEPPKWPSSLLDIYRPQTKRPPGQTPPRADKDSHCSGRYASYWSALLFTLFCCSTCPGCTTIWSWISAQPETRQKSIRTECLKTRNGKWWRLQSGSNTCKGSFTLNDCECESEFDITNCQVSNT